MELRPEIKLFCDAAETLLSRVMTPMTDEEWTIVREYAKTLERAAANRTDVIGPLGRIN
jgi:hypothetical protein